MTTPLYDQPRKEVRGVLVSFMEPIELLREKITNYFRQYDGEDHWNTFPVQAYFLQMLRDICDDTITTSPAQRMIANEISHSAKYLVEAGINPGTAVIIELTIFRHVVDILSSTLPDMEFGDDDKYSFSFANAMDVLIDIPIPTQEE